MTTPDDILEFEYIVTDLKQVVHNCEHPAARCADDDHRHCPHCHRAYCAFDNGHRCEPLKQKNDRLLRQGEHERELLAQPIRSAHTEANVEAFFLALVGVLVATGAFNSPGPRNFALLVVLALTFMWREMRRSNIGSVEDPPSARELAPGYPIIVETGQYDSEQMSRELSKARERYGQDVLSRDCPRCGARIQALCVNPATGTRRPEPHDAR